MGITLNQDQRDAIDKMHDFLSDPDQSLFVLRGYAGTGKTTCIQTLLREEKVVAVLTAPTNKATRVLSQISKSEGVDCECCTIYSLLGLRLTSNSDIQRVEAIGESKVDMYQLMVVDEGSMVGEVLLGHIMEASLEANVKVIFMMDPMQLPPVGEDRSPLMDAPCSASLTKVERHDNQILALATQVRLAASGEGDLKLKSSHDENGGVYVVRPNAFNGKITSGFTSLKYQEDPETFKCIAWRNKTVNFYNSIIRKGLYGDKELPKFMEGERVVAASPVMVKGPDGWFAEMTTDEEAEVQEVVECGHPVFEDIKCYKLLLDSSDREGYVTAFVPHEESMKLYSSKLKQAIDIAKKDRSKWGHYWALKKDFFSDIRPCHAITAHRSQGSTYDTTFVDAGDILANRNKLEGLKCLYVAVSRASRIVVMRK